MNIETYLDKFYNLRAKSKPPEPMIKKQIISAVEHLLKTHHQYKFLKEEETDKVFTDACLGKYDDESYVQHFDISSVNRWFKTYYTGDRLKAVKDYFIETNRPGGYDFKPNETDGEMGDIALWLVKWRYLTSEQMRHKPTHEDDEKSKDFIASLKQWQIKKLKSWMKQYRPKEDLTKWINEQS